MHGLLGVFDILTEMFQSLSKKLQLPNVMGGIIMAIVGLAIAILSRRVARAVRKTNQIDDNDKVMIAVKTVGLLLMFSALLVLVFA